MKDSHPDCAVPPDVLIQPPAPSGFLYNGTHLPASIGAMNPGAAWVMEPRAEDGYMVARIPCATGKANGEYQEFLTGFITPEGKVWGRPVGIAVAKDGSLLVSDDGSGSIWRVSYQGK